MKFGVFGSIGEVKFLRDKNIGKFSTGGDQAYFMPPL